MQTDSTSRTSGIIVKIKKFAFPDFYITYMIIMFLSTSDKMKFVIPGINVKTTGKAIHCLAKIGDEIYLEPSLDSLTLRSVNLSRSGCRMKITFYLTSIADRPSHSSVSGLHFSPQLSKIIQGRRIAK